MTAPAKPKRRLNKANRAQRQARRGSAAVQGRPQPPRGGERPTVQARPVEAGRAAQARASPAKAPAAQQARRWGGQVPMAALSEALEEVFLSRNVLTRQGWRPSSQPREGRMPAPGGPGRDKGQVPNPWRALAEEAMGLHESYTEREGEFARDRNPIHHRIGGYQFYYLPRNLLRVLYVLDSLPWRAVNPEMRARDFVSGETFRVLDLGCGSGAFSLALLAWLAVSGARAGQLPPLEITLVDQSRALLEIAQANLEAFATRALPGLRLAVKGHAEGVSRYLDRPLEEPARFALTGAAMTLNELGLVGSDRRIRSPRTLERVAGLVARGGVLLLVEPGTHEGYLNIMAVREAFRSVEGHWPILYPCPHADACPMFADTPRRWCHATIGLPDPFFFDDVLRKKGHLPLSMRELNLSGLVLQSSSSGRAEGAFLPRAGSRAVSNRMPGRGAQGHGPVLLLCTEQGGLVERPADELGSASRGDWVPGPRRSQG